MNNGAGFTVVEALTGSQKVLKKSHASFPERFTDKPAKVTQAALGRPEVGTIRNSVLWLQLEMSILKEEGFCPNSGQHMLSKAEILNKYLIRNAKKFEISNWKNILPWSWKSNTNAPKALSRASAQPKLLWTHCSLGKRLFLMGCREGAKGMCAPKVT